jgi:crotonobetainyl-CoA:carnitine CoA-transferase CaiB-like acyl-CoA transferase
MTAPHGDSSSSGSGPAATDDERAAARDRMRRKLADARQRHDAAYWAQLRERFGLPARTA